MGQPGGGYPRPDREMRLERHLSRRLRGFVAASIDDVNERRRREPEATPEGF
jgi:hypothetical protein